MHFSIYFLSLFFLASLVVHVAPMPVMSIVPVNAGKPGQPDVELTANPRTREAMKINAKLDATPPIANGPIDKMKYAQTNWLEERTKGFDDDIWKWWLDKKMSDRDEAKVGKAEFKMQQDYADAAVRAALAKSAKSALAPGKETGKTTTPLSAKGAGVKGAKSLLGGKTAAAGRGAKGAKSSLAGISGKPAAAAVRGAKGAKSSLAGKPGKTAGKPAAGRAAKGSKPPLTGKAGGTATKAAARRGANLGAKSLVAGKAGKAPAKAAGGKSPVRGAKGAKSPVIPSGKAAKRVAALGGVANARKQVTTKRPATPVNKPLASARPRVKAGKR